MRASAYGLVRTSRMAADAAANIAGMNRHPTVNLIEGISKRLSSFPIEELADAELAWLFHRAEANLVAVIENIPEFAVPATRNEAGFVFVRIATQALREQELFEAKMKLLYPDWSAEETFYHPVAPEIMDIGR
jgi:hypothetical protein